MALKALEGGKSAESNRRITVRGNDDLYFFLSFVGDFGFRDMREMMERPFFAISKTRKEPINYLSPDGKTHVTVSADPTYGLATIWDADILIYLASVICEMKRQGVNDIPRKVTVRPNDLLKAIGRRTGGREYELLAAGLDRLVATTIKTNIRAKGRREATFSWLDGWSQVIDEREMTQGYTLEMSNWFYEGLVLENGVLKIDPRYFQLKGGLDRWLYRVARKHAGRHGEKGFEIGIRTLYEKSGSSRPLRLFKHDLLKIVDRDNLPGINLVAVGERKQLKLRMIYTGDEGEAEVSCKKLLRKTTNQCDQVVPLKPKNPVVQGATTESEDYIDPKEAKGFLKQVTSAFGAKASYGILEPETVTHLRENCPGWDIYALHVDFDAWLAADPSRTPANYQAAFIAWAKKHNERNRHTLGR